MHAGAEATRAIMPQHCALDEHFLFPVHELTDEAAEGGVRQESAVGRIRMDAVKKLSDLLFWTTANTLVGEWVRGGIEDAGTWWNIGREDAGG